MVTGTVVILFMRSGAVIYNLVWLRPHSCYLLHPLQDGRTPLHLAAKEGHTTCVERLLYTPGIDVNIKSRVSWSIELMLSIKRCTSIRNHWDMGTCRYTYTQ